MRNDTESALIIVKGSRSRKLDFPNIYVTFSVNFTNIKGLFACQCYWFDISFVILVNEGDFVRLAPTCFSPLLFMFLRILSLTKYDKTRTPLQRHSALALLGVRPRNEETINNSTRNRIYSLNVFYLFLNWFSMLVSMEKRLRSQAIRLYKYTKIQVSWFQRNYIIAKDPKVTFMARTSFQSSPKINRILITYRSHLHTVKVYNTRPSQFCSLRFLFLDHSVVFTCSKVIDAFKW